MGSIFPNRAWEHWFRVALRVLGSPPGVNRRAHQFSGSLMSRALISVAFDDVGSHGGHQPLFRLC